ncbi:hypothetical protein X777_06495 [Ooceraea biroi]|uniref:Uncharacterized protein n=1 Tax=Ooceraea biroi TaxID=2015173 RepID=A0A026WEF6_OOCBI|nr:hypothetical protein X777_06495 [Ooceraea biroi]
MMFSLDRTRLRENRKPMFTVGSSAIERCCSIRYALNKTGKKNMLKKSFILLKEIRKKLHNC